MSSKIKVKSSYFENNNGNASLSSYEFSQDNEIREITLDNTGFIDDALAIVETEMVSGTISMGPYPFVGDVSISPSTSKIDSSVTLVVNNGANVSELLLGFTASDGPITTSSDFPIGTVSFFKNSFVPSSSRNINYLYNVDKGGNYVVDSYESPILENNVSFGLLRTNPALTGNVKITVDSATRVWLNSIDANPQLSDSRFKRVPVSINSNYVIDVFNFFDNGSTPPEIVYDLYQQSGSYLSTQRDFSNQYDRFYTYGAAPDNTSFYTENFSYFAPLWINDVLPDYFVIFRANGPVNYFTYDQSFDSWKNFVNSDILKKSEIISTFDLSENSNIGTYIRNLINHPARTNSDLTLSLQSTGYTTFNGISYTEGSFAQKGELLSNYFSTASTIMGTEEFLTKGFQRNKILSSNILNLEFMFDDFSAENYSINRYFGLYMKKNELATFFISDQALQQNSLVIGQTPLPRKGVDGNKLSSRNFVQNNPDGIKLFVDSSSIVRTKDPLEIFTSKVKYSASETSVILDGQWSNSPYLSVGDSLTFFKPGSTVVESSAIVSFVNQGNKIAEIGLTGYVTSGATVSSLFGYEVNFSTPEKVSSRILSTFDNDLIQNSSRLFYLQDKNGNFYNINGTSLVSTKVDSFSSREDVQVNLNEKTLDISNFTGIDEMLTQIPAKILTTSGQSVMEFEVINTFQDYDFVEISHINTSSEPMRWRIQAQSPLLNPGENWPDYSVMTDADGSKYYLTLFHPGDFENLTQLALTIENAFKIFPFRNFDVVSKGTKIYFRSQEPGDSGNSLSLDLSLKTVSLNAFGFSNPIGKSSLNFMGGSSLTKNRVSLERATAEGIINGEYFKTTGNYSPLKQYSIFGNVISYFSYLEEPLYDVVEQVSEFVNAESYAVIELDSPSKFQLTFDGKVTSYSLQSSKFGIFSMFPLKDFDFDNIVSDYGRNYNPELVEYFDNAGALTYDLFLNTGSTDSSNPFYQVDFFEPMGLSGEYTFLGVYDDGRTPIDLNGSAQLKFSSLTSSVADLSFYRGLTGNSLLDSVSLTGSNMPNKLVVLPGNKILYFEENLLSKFKGFFTLSSISSSQASQIFTFKESQWDFSRFFQTRISTEYDRLQENYIKDLVLTSKVVPYSVKWVSPDGKDIRDNPYRLNFSKAFGTMNFSPSGAFPEADSEIHTHEWPYIANVPKDVDPTKYPNFSFSYFFENPDFGYDFTSVTRDWFSEYFVTGYPSEIYTVNDEDVLVPMETSERYSTFRYDTLTQKSFTIFRGIRLEVGEVLTANDSILLGSSKYDGYKFSSVIVPLAEDDFTSNNGVSSDIIVNEKFGFILHLIRVRISNYKNPDGNLSYVDLYTMENRRNRATYRIDPNMISPRGEDYFYVKAIPNDIEFPSAIVNLGSNYILRTVDFSGSLKDYINPSLSSGSYSFPYSIGNYGNTQKSYVFGNISIVSDGQISLSTNAFSEFLPIIPIAINKFFPVSDDFGLQNFYYASGGDSYYNRVRESLSFYEITKILQRTSTAVSPTQITVGIDGSIVANMAILRVVQPVKFYQPYDHYPLPDPAKPSELFNYSIIGAVSATSSNPQYLYRYQGDFVPKFRNILLFGSREQENFALQYNNDFRLANTFIAEALDDTYYLRNQYFCKVADEEILRINPSSGYQSVYPLVNEISIATKDLFIWNSTWDSKYYRKYSTVTDFIEIDGISSMKEIKSFLGSKMMKISNNFSLYEFVISGESPELSWTQVGSLVTVTIDAHSRFLREMMGTTASVNARKEFIEFSSNLPDVLPSINIESAVTSYLEDNVVSLYRIDSVDFYLLQTGNSISKSSDSSRPLVEFNVVSGDETTLTENQLISENYSLVKDVKTSILPNLQVQVQFNLDSRFYTSLGFGVEIVRI